MRDAASDSFRTFLCGHCLQEVSICRKCDRGHRYCCLTCRNDARREQCRAARRRYQSSEAGAEKHRQSQRKYAKEIGEKKSAERLTDHSSLIAPDPSESPRINKKPYVNHCCICGRKGNGITRLGFIRTIEGERCGYKQRSDRRNNSPVLC